MENINQYWDSSRDDYSNRPEILFQEEHLNYLDDCEVIVDLGCGTGNLVEKLEKMGKIVKGITYNEDEVKAAKKNGVHVEYGNMHSLKLINSSVDAIVMWDSLEHCVSPYVALCEARRVTKNGGKGLIFMPGLNWLDCHCHICTYTVPQMKQLFKQSGWKLIKVHEKKYPNNEKEYCEGMAIYEIENDPKYQAVFAK